MQKLNDKEINQVQNIVGSILYYAGAVDMTLFMVLSTIASEQTKGTERPSATKNTGALRQCISRQHRK